VITRRTVLSTVALTAVAQPVYDRKILEAVIDRIVPADENGPGAIECGAANYIVQALAGPLEQDKTALTEGLRSVDALARSKHGVAFVDLPSEQKDDVLTAIETSSRPFFNRIRQLTLEGMFSDPQYGGNRDYRGWDLIRYPGPRMAVSAKEQVLRDPIKPLRPANHGH
jgi:hypothetical protein